MKTLITLTAMSILLVSCSSTTRQDEQREESMRELEIEYKLQETSTGLAKQPDWILSPKSGDEDGSPRTYRYFVNESESKSKRLALQSAKARASATVAQEIVSFIKNSYGEATQGGDGEDITEYKQEQLAKETQTFLHGAEIINTYWEKRKYLKEKGADKDHTIYKAFALVRVNKDTLKEAIERASKKFLSDVKDPEVKDKASKAIEEAKEAFSNAN